MSILETKTIKFPITLYTIETEQTTQSVTVAGQEKQLEISISKVIAHNISNILKLLQFADRYQNIARRIDYLYADVFTDRSLAYEVCNTKNRDSIYSIINSIEELYENRKECKI